VLKWKHRTHLSYQREKPRTKILRNLKPKLSFKTVTKSKSQDKKSQDKASKSKSPNKTINSGKIESKQVQPVFNKSKKQISLEPHKTPEAIAQKKELKEKLEEKYDANLKDSDDSSDEEVLLRTGNVPRHWYDLYDHQGYSVKGKQVEKMLEEDELQKFISRQENKDWWLRIKDELNNRNVQLSRADLELIQRIRGGHFADKSIDPFEGFYFEFDNQKDFIHPFNQDNPKRRFQPSKWERLKINKFIQALKKGWMKTLAEQQEEDE